MELRREPRALEYIRAQVAERGPPPQCRGSRTGFSFRTGAARRGFGAIMAAIFFRTVSSMAFP
jgi:hypothetical protein